MIGNDVVDLADPETCAQQLHPRFDQRILNDQEQLLVKNAEDPHALRWTLWAAKEASYKRGRKLFPELGFSPRQFETQLKRNGDIQVEHPRLSSCVKIKLKGPYVHALALPNERCVSAQLTRMTNTTVAISQLEIAPDTRPSQRMYRFAYQTLANQLQIQAHELRIIKHHRIPYLLDLHQQILGDLSLSHHGRFLALAFQPHIGQTQ